LPVLVRGKPLFLVKLPNVNSNKIQMCFLDFVSIVGFWLSVTAEGVCEKGENL